MSDIAEKIEHIGSSVDAFKQRYENQLQQEVAERKALATEVAMLRAGRAAEPTNGGMTESQHWREVKTGRIIPVLAHGQRLAGVEQQLPHGLEGKTLPSVGRLLRGIVLGGRADDARELADERKAMAISADASGGVTVPSIIAAEWIDLFRARMVLSQAGARTVVMPGKDLTLARVTSDPTVQWHGENANITAGDPGLGAITLAAKTAVALVKFSLELAQDSPNIEIILQSTLTNALAAAIDSAGLNGVTANAGAAPSGIMNLSGRNTVTSVGAPTSWDFLVNGVYELLADNVPLESVGAFIGHPAIWKKMLQLKTGIASDNTPLAAPAEIARLPKLWTTAAPLSGSTAAGIVGNWADLLFGIRQDITVRVLSEAFMGSNLQLAVLVYARCDFGAARPTSFCTMEGITVS